MTFKAGNQYAKGLHNGRPGMGLEFKRIQIKNKLLDQIGKELEEDPEKLSEWAKRLADKLFPTEVSGKDGEPVKFDVVMYGTGDRLYNSLQLDTRTPSVESAGEQSEIQDDNLASESKEDDTGN